MVPYRSLDRKLFVATARGAPPLRRLGAPFWERVVSAAGARVLSRFGNDVCDAYLLSESSLFVHDDRALLITCGATPLTAAEHEIRAAIAPAHVATLLCDVGETNQGGIELTMEDLDPGFCAVVDDACRSGDARRVRAALGFDELFPGFAVDEHAFQPPGYSLNALRGAHHCALHITPHPGGSFATLDTSWTGAADDDLVDRLLETVQPRRCRFQQQLY